MSAAGWVLVIIAYLAVRAVVRANRAPKPYKMALVARSPELHEQIVAQHKREHDTFAQRHTFDWGIK